MEKFEHLQNHIGLGEEEKDKKFYCHSLGTDIST